MRAQVRPARPSCSSFCFLRLRVCTASGRGFSGSSGPCRNLHSSDQGCQWVRKESAGREEEILVLLHAASKFVSRSTSAYRRQKESVKTAGGASHSIPSSCSRTARPPPTSFCSETGFADAAPLFTYACLQHSFTRESSFHSTSYL